MKLLAPLVFFLALTASIGCNESTEECPQDQMCTEEFRFITLEAKDTAQAPYLLDSVHTVVVESGAVVHPMEQMMDPGIYIVLSDNEKNLTSLAGDTFLFNGFKGGLLKVSEQFVIRHDCCHINWVSGSTSVTIP